MKNLTRLITSTVLFISVLPADSTFVQTGVAPSFITDTGDSLFGGSPYDAGRGILSGTDLDGDEKKEVWITSYQNGGQVFCFEETGSDTLAFVWASAEITTEYSTPRDVHTGDLDGDGNGEIIFHVGRWTGVDNPDAGLHVYEWDGTDNGYGTEAAFRVDFMNALNDSLAESRVEGFSVGDIDGDGMDEILLANNGTSDPVDGWGAQDGSTPYSGDRFIIMSVTGDIGSFGTAIVEEYSMSPRDVDKDGVRENALGGGSPMDMVICDTDGDGLLEAACFSWNNLALFFIEATGANAYTIGDTSYLKLGISDDWTLGASVADMNGDGKDEVYVSGFYDGSLFVITDADGDANSIDQTGSAGDWTTNTEVAIMHEFGQNNGFGVGATAGFGVTMGRGNWNEEVYDINFLQLADGGEPMNTSDWSLTTHILNDATTGMITKHNGGLDFDDDGQLEVVLPYKGVNDTTDTGELDPYGNRVFRIAEWGIDSNEPNIFQPQTTAELQTAVDLWVSDNATALETYGEINTWDVSLITDMSSLFQDKASFNDNIGNWDVSNVTNMMDMFSSATSFNGDIGNWDVSSVTTMQHMFSMNDSLNQDLSSWDVSNVTDMSDMFFHASSFNGDLSGWDVSSVTNMARMFRLGVFNGDLSGWDVSSVTTMVRMFQGVTNFNQDLSSWDVSSVVSMLAMFYSASSFNKDLSAWNVSSVTNMSYMFDGADALSDENKCAIHTSFSSNENWPYDWSEFCDDAAEPQITSITDVPDDQGGWVYVEFTASLYDTPEETGQQYAVYRFDTYEDTSAWVMVTSGPAIYQDQYIFEVHTSGDSTSEDDGMTEFKVVASMNAGIFHSDPMMGYSVDNIAPGVPGGLMATVLDEGIHLTWDVSVEEDFQYFTLEKSLNSEFQEYESFETIDTSYTDAEYALNQINYYRLVAVDHAGNVSGYSDVVEATVLSIDGELLPEVFSLHQNYPNPFNPTTQIKYDLHEDAMVSVTIYDIMGRSIRSLVKSQQTAGYRSIQWNATNNLGEPVSAGMYIYTIQAGEFRQVRKMVLLK